MTLALATLSMTTLAWARDAVLANRALAPADRDVAALGRKIFFDPSLSASGKMSCSSCHDPAHAYGPPNGLPVQLGGPQGDRQGMRAVPSLRYVLNRTPRWHQPYASSLAERLRDGNEPPSGGFGADGRFASLHEQAAFPLLSPNEMANASPAAVVAALARTRYASDFRRLYGKNIFSDVPRAFAQALMAIERFELEDSTFHPFDSKYDAFLDGRTILTAQERRGLALFEDPRRGNCAGCHTSRLGADGSHPIFTDFQFGALGVPRNPALSANRDATYFDQGLCGPAREDVRTHHEYCGMFKTPTMRNVATRRVFFHNGRVHSLTDALRFYASRDARAEQWYPRARNDHVVKFDDLPPSARANVDTATAPFTRRRGSPALWSDAEIADVVAFLNTLTDGFREPPKR